ncbi:PilT/PilU family type 4a pilus ATPase [Thalassotalea sp. G20_0]|uniref:PilT/PilU family type 4a pilus ATPase n=1 Tax=Thalassotalea sp. G20_0 TaxID=2821093 RepID=UPI001AD9C38B|nr:PilT/PilU family type 4a pilus ATPase [Thalassotalea sp. G20_0]MBO9494042.1 PilT/PilU family type 4a pilus ATPase [Thalassotalea sp. G20_0]
MDIEKLLKLVAVKKASDLFITAGYPPSVKLDGRLIPVNKTPLTATEAKDMVLGVMDEKQRLEFELKQECNFAIAKMGVGRFRVSAFQQRNQSGMVLRRIEEKIPGFEELKLPPILKDLTMVKRGLVILVGATGTGKSTTLAAMLGYRNENDTGHIISIEDPIEFIHQHRRCIVTQREVGIDTKSYEVALKNTLRQAPDVIMIGEIRSQDTMQYALNFAETGHLCLATLHANNANQALDRILHFFPPEHHHQVWMDLSLNLKGIVAQQLVPSLDGTGRLPAIEVLLNTPLAQDMIRKGDAHALKELMKKSRELGMQTFDQALFDLYNRGEVSYEDAIRYADSANDLRLMIKLGSEVDESYLTQRSGKLTLQMEEA